MKGQPDKSTYMQNHRCAGAMEYIRHGRGPDGVLRSFKYKGCSQCGAPLGQVTMRAIKGK